MPDAAADRDRLAEEVRALGAAHGLDAVGIAGADPLLRARAALHERGAAGLSDTMGFTYRNPERSTDPGRAVADARSIVVGARSYLRDDPGRPDEPAARVGRYAWVDHYAPLRSALWVIARHLRAAGHRAVAYADDNSVVDREVAHRAGLGWFGKNANLLLPRHGSWFVLGCVVTTAELPPAAGPADDGCGACRRCLDACPTGAIVGPGVVDARRCLSWVLQKPGPIPEHLRGAVGDRLYGCDDCQEVCPPNVRFGRSRPAEPGTVAWVPLVELLDADDEQLLARHGHWYLAGRDPTWLRRNALVVLGNLAPRGDPAVAAAVRRYLEHPHPVLREQAAWTAARLGLGAAA
jgi:epoxyqueuosine reductase